MSRVLEGQEEPQRSSLRDGGVLLGLEVVVIIHNAWRLARGPPSSTCCGRLARGPLRRGGAAGVVVARRARRPLVAATARAARRHGCPVGCPPVGVPAARASDDAAEQPYGAAASTVMPRGCRTTSSRAGARRPMRRTVFVKTGGRGAAGRAERCPARRTLRLGTPAGPAVGATTRRGK